MLQYKSPLRSSSDIYEIEDARAVNRSTSLPTVSFVGCTLNYDFHNLVGLLCIYVSRKYLLAPPYTVTEADLRQIMQAVRKAYDSVERWVDQEIGIGIGRYLRTAPVALWRCTNRAVGIQSQF